MNEETMFWYFLIICGIGIGYVIRDLIQYYKERVKNTKPHKQK